ncbi:hypothetical protein EJ04DRAFT_560616 [Polyplosphaeria fusca]|uniref:Uncharacterized protein n=1 Tax=Polyplosphaeria fusca TaxID=682080 RepID=A0A9P4V6S0_9PLEO|nr:hypothetical protein EJ04DRAFT_560616 [Polyplosphaeria fusca]
MAQPVVVCGRNPKVSEAVRANLVPEYEVIHILMSLEAAQADIPDLLSGKAPADPASNKGSQNYTSTPVAVCIGGGYDDNAFDSMRKASTGLAGVPWLRPDKSRLAEMPPRNDPEGYGKATAERIKVALDDLREQGVFGKDGVYLY